MFISAVSFVLLFGSFLFREDSFTCKNAVLLLHALYKYICSYL